MTHREPPQADIEAKDFPAVRLAKIKLERVPQPESAEKNETLADEIETILGDPVSQRVHFPDETARRTTIHFPAAHVRLSFFSPPR